MELWSIALCHYLLRFLIPFRYQSFSFEAKNSWHPCSTSAILSKILPQRKCAIDLKRWKSDGEGPGCKLDVVATSLHRIPSASIAFFWKYEAWHYLAGTTHGFCFFCILFFYFSFKLCTFDQIVHNIIQNSSPCPLVQVRNGEHPCNSSKRRASPLFRSFAIYHQLYRLLGT